MRRLASTAAAAVVLALGSAAAAQTVWEIDGAHSSVQFSVRHLMITDVRGRFGTLTGSARADEQDLARSVIEATIDAASIGTREQKRDAHLRSADFLDVERHPTITFRSTAIAPAGDGRWRVTGDLTLHGMTRPVVLDVEGPTAHVKDNAGNTRAGARATTRLNRKDFGITWSKTMDGGGLVVGDEIDVTIDVQGIRRAAAAAAE
jgi:polyisoprenoid-binding protein YceI